LSAIQERCLAGPHARIRLTARLNFARRHGLSHATAQALGDERRVCLIPDKTQLHYPTPTTYFDLYWRDQLRVAPGIALSAEPDCELTTLARSKVTRLRLVPRAQIVLLATQGLQIKDIAERLGIERVQVARWFCRHQGGWQWNGGAVPESARRPGS
jgi:hypothetical protein